MSSYSLITIFVVDINYLIKKVLELTLLTCDKGIFSRHCFKIRIFTNSVCSFMLQSSSRAINGLLLLGIAQKIQIALKTRMKYALVNFPHAESWLIAVVYNSNKNFLLKLLQI